MLLLWFAGLVLFPLSLHAQEHFCPGECICNFFTYNGDEVICGNHSYSLVNGNNSSAIINSENCSHTATNLLTDAVTLKIGCFNSSSLNASKLILFQNLSDLSITESNLSSFPLKLVSSFQSLSYLNLSGNGIQNIYFPMFANLSLIELDLSWNSISEASFEKHSLPYLKKLHMQKNDVISFSEISNLPSLEFLDLSFNPMNLKESQLYYLENLKTLFLRNVLAASNFHRDLCGKEARCRLLPGSLNSLDLSENFLKKIPSCDGLLAGLYNLVQLNLKNNQITVINDDSFQSYCFSNLTFLSLENNHLIKVYPNSLVNFKFLNSLNLGNNYLQHIPLNILQQFAEIKQNISNETGILLYNNPWSCDCFQQATHMWLQKTNFSVPLFCYLPQTLRNQKLRSVNASQLLCTDTVLMSEKLNFIANEYKDGYLACGTTGTPKPIVSWISPSGDVISVESLTNQEKLRNFYNLSVFGEILTIHNVRLENTGLYKCVANNSYSSANQTVAISVVLNNTSTIIYIVLACVAFMVAIVLNSVNMCMYMYEHYETRRLYKKALRQQDQEEKENPPIRARSKTLDESMASLNANRHYGRYDFTCQQLFLDSILKGAYTVKKTLYDARHSEFSVNMWEYAANLRDRLHIEMPSVSNVQLPNISMPTISMPNISMPSIPTMQDINTNIEKLGSSMMHRSHVFATSVGSVFTLKRWMWQPENSSDSESRDSDEQLATEAGFTEVRVDVHDVPKPNEGGEEPCTSKIINYVDRSNREDKFVQVEVKKTKSLPAYNVSQPTAISQKRRPKRAKVSLKEGESKIVRFNENTDKESMEDTSLTQPRQSIVEENPSLNTIIAAVNGNYHHSYETSV